MKELKAPDKVMQKMTRDGAVSENLATGEVEQDVYKRQEVSMVIVLSQSGERRYRSHTTRARQDP